MGMEEGIFAIAFGFSQGVFIAAKHLAQRPWLVADSRTL